MEDTKIEDEKSVGLLSSKCVESQSIALPKDIFRNSFTWYCYQIYKSFAFHFWLILWLPLSVWWKLASDWFYPFLTCMFMFLGLCFAPFILMICRKHAISKQYTRFCKEIIKSAPGTDSEDWESIVINLNSYMYENKLWNNRYFFFDGWSCQQSFRLCILNPFSLKKDNDAKVKSFKESVPYIEEALKVYFGRVDELWKQICSEKSLSAIGFKDTPLPKQSYRFKAVWSFKTTMNRRYFLTVILPFLCHIFPSLELDTFFRVLYLGSTFLSLTKSYQDSRVAPMKMEDKMQYLLTIINEQEIHASGWDQIAKKMNVYLFEQKVYSNKEFFFDGIDCKRFFDCNFSSLLSSKKSVPPLLLNVELWPYIKEAQLACGDESSA
ncbi:hypothetical protein SUVZ_14G0040 [Saccharomyces uvarum]|uniref:Uncharacterized protein n=1 Tax=Saccharomyces uvarum TaxID=230603 RepID=A0ABN8WMZ1_SACUV|nr:hypothetical protein SUVZ_14G0040 [Saccharomyces uvarum]